MNSWLKGATFNQSNSKAVTSGSSFLYGVDQVAAFNAFVQHWNQILEVFHQSNWRKKVTSDDVTAVVNHFMQMVNFLLVDLRQLTSTSLSDHEQRELKPFGANAGNNDGNSIGPTPHTPIFDHFMGERILQSILQWSMTSGEFTHVMQLEQLKVYEMLISNSHPEILVYKPITEPLLVLLESCSGCVPVEVEKRLVVLLNQLWVSLMHNQHLLKYFFLPSDCQIPKFLIFSQLLPFIHREGGIGQQARDALLLAMSLSSSHHAIANYIADHSNFCPVLAAGLSGLYSMLPRTLNIRTEGWYRICPEDIPNIHPLQMFISSLEFCNAIVQLAHPVVKKQLVDYLYQGFLVPVVGPALNQNVTEELVAAIAYIELFIQAVTEENLRRAFLALLLSSQNCSELPLVTSLISHLHSPNQLSLVVMNLFNTLISLHSEDAMIVLVFQYLTPCTHVMLSQRTKLPQPPFFAADRLLELLPKICQHEASLKTQTTNNCFNDCQRSRTHSLSQHQSSTELETSTMNSPTPFSVYLKEAKKKVESSFHACSMWAWMYDSINPLPTEAVLMINESKLAPAEPYTKVRSHSDPYPHSLPYANAQSSPDCDKKRSSSLPNYMSGKVDKNSVNTSTAATNKNTSKLKDIHSKGCDPKGTLNNSFVSPLHMDETHLDSLGESSGYDSFNLKGSRDPSPLHSKNIRKSNSSKGVSSNGLPEQFSSAFFEPSLVENCKRSYEADVDEDFLQFLDRSQSPLQSEEDSVQIIEDAFVESVGVPESTKRISNFMSLCNIDQEIDVQTQWLADSYSSLEEDESDNHKDLLNSHPKPTIGPFLEALISHIDNLLASSTHESLLAMSCITNLACYPCPLITSLLLQPSVVLQPSVRSLYQALSQLKQKIDNMLKIEDLPVLLDARWRFSQNFYMAEPIREQSPPTTSSFVRGGEKRRSFSQTISAFFKLSPLPERNTFRESSLQNLPDGSGYRFIKAPSSPTTSSSSAFLSASTQKQKAATCTILLHEWLLELAALAQEHTVSCPPIQFRTIKESC